MGRRGRRHPDAASKAPEPSKPVSPKWLLGTASLIILIGASVIGVALAQSNQEKPVTSVATQPTGSAAQPNHRAHQLGDLLNMTPEQLAKVDIAEMNLLCATGLPGAENLNIDHCMARLDEWAAHVKSETERHLYRAHDPKWADHYKHSENWLRAEFLAQVLQEDCGVHYNMERVRNIDFRNSKDLLIHGMIDDANGGTCASMPMLYVAVGRRLGYPLKMVTTKGHVFVRWDDGKDRFNIEVTSDGGTDSHPDDYYRNWPEKLTDAEVKTHRYLVPLSPAEELADSLSNRGHCLLDNGRTQEALRAYTAAHRLAPNDPVYASWMRQAQAKLRPRTREAIEPPLVHRGETVESINARNQQMLEANTRPPVVAAPYGSQTEAPYVAQPGAPQLYQPSIPVQPR